MHFTAAITYMHINLFSILIFAFQNDVCTKCNQLNEMTLQILKFYLNVDHNVISNGCTFAMTSRCSSTTVTLPSSTTVTNYTMPSSTIVTNYTMPISTAMIPVIISVCSITLCATTLITFVCVLLHRKRKRKRLTILEYMH